MNEFKGLLFNHKVAIILALFTCFLVTFPQIYFRIDHKDDGIYQGIELLPDAPWSARVREIQDGHGFGSIYYKDGKNDPYLFQPVGSTVVAYMGSLLSLDINNTILLSRFVLPFIAFIVLYVFVYLLFRDKAMALASASLILLGESVLSYSGVERLIRGISPTSFLELARPVNSAMIFIPFFGFLISFWTFHKNKKWQYGALSAILLGLNFYNYFYTWTYLYAFGGVLFIIFLLRRGWQEVVRISSVFVGALLLLVPYALNIYRASQHPTYDEVSLRFGIVMTYAPLFVGFVVIGALLVFLLGFPREDRKKYYFGLALLLTPFVTMNQQLITGKILQPGHYHWYFHKPIAIIFVLSVIFYVLNRLNWFSIKKMFATTLIAISLATGVIVQAGSYYSDYASRDGGYIAIERQKYGPVMKWFNDNANKEDVVLANDEASHMTVIYTSLNVFYHRAGLYTLSATEKRLLDVLFTFYRLREVGESDVRDVFYDERGYLSANIYGMHYKEVFGLYEAIPDDKIEEILEEYLETLSTPTSEWLRGTLSKYEVEYIIWDKKENPSWQLDRFNFLEQRAGFGDLVIYQVIP